MPARLSVNTPQDTDPKYKHVTLMSHATEINANRPDHDSPLSHCNGPYRRMHFDANPIREGWSYAAIRPETNLEQQTFQEQILHRLQRQGTPFVSNSQADIQRRSQRLGAATTWLYADVPQTCGCLTYCPKSTYVQTCLGGITFRLDAWVFAYPNNSPDVPLVNACDCQNLVLPFGDCDERPFHGIITAVASLDFDDYGIPTTAPVQTSGDIAVRNPLGVTWKGASTTQWITFDARGMPSTSTIMTDVGLPWTNFSGISIDNAATSSHIGEFVPRWLRPQHVQSPWLTVPPFPPSPPPLPPPSPPPPSPPLFGSDNVPTGLLSAFIGPPLEGTLEGAFGEFKDEVWCFKTPLHTATNLKDCLSMCEEQFSQVCAWITTAAGDCAIYALEACEWTRQLKHDSPQKTYQSQELALRYYLEESPHPAFNQLSVSRYTQSHDAPHTAATFPPLPECNRNRNRLSIWWSWCRDDALSAGRADCPSRCTLASNGAVSPHHESIARRYSIPSAWIADGNKFRCICSAATETAIGSFGRRLQYVEQPGPSECTAMPVGTRMLTTTKALRDALVDQTTDYGTLFELYAATLSAWSHAPFMSQGAHDAVDRFDCCASFMLTDEKVRCTIFIHWASDKLHSHPSTLAFEEEMDAQEKERVNAERAKGDIRFPQGYATLPKRGRRKMDVQGNGDGHREVPLSELKLTLEDVQDALYEHMDEVCCVKPTTPAARAELGADEHCHRSHCADQLRLQGIARAGRRLRTQRKDGVRDSPPKPGKAPPPPPKSTDAVNALKPSLQVAIDLVNDHSHPVKGCEYVLTHGRSAGATGDRKNGFSQAECAVLGVAHRVAEYHGIEIEKVRSVFSTLGKDATEIVARFASMFVKGSGASTSTHDPMTPTTERRREERIEELRRQLHGEMTSGFEKAYGRRMQEFDDQSAHQEMVVEGTDPSGSMISPDIMVNDPGIVHGVNLTSTMKTMGAATMWGDAAKKQSATLHQLGRRNSARVFQTHARRGSLEEATRTPSKGVSGVVSMAEGLAAYVVSSDGSITKSIRDAVGGGGRANKLLRDAKSLMRDAAAKSREIDKHREELEALGRRRLHANASYKDGIDGMHQRRIRHAKTPGRLHNFIHVGLKDPPPGHPHMVGLGVASKHARMPADIPRGDLHNWLLDSVDWSRAYQRMHEAVDVERERMEWGAAGANGELPGNVRNSWIGNMGLGHIAPTAIGRAARTLGYSIRHGKLPEWETDGKMSKSTEYHRDKQHKQPEGLKNWAEAPGIMDGRKRTGGARRLFESFGTGIFNNTLVVPHSHEDAGKTQKKAAGALESVVSYMVYNVFLCYLYKPEPEHATLSNKLGDGTEVKTHRSQHMCFPGLPISIPFIPTFTELTGLDVDSIGNMNFADVCGKMWVDDWVDTVADAFAAPYGDTAAATAMKRMFYNPVAAVHSIRNLVQASNADSTQLRTIHAACALARFNGLLWTIGFFILLVGVYLGCCWPCVNLFSLCFRQSAERRRRSSESDDEMDKAINAMFRQRKRKNAIRHARVHGQAERSPLVPQTPDKRERAGGLYGRPVDF